MRYVPLTYAECNFILWVDLEGGDIMSMTTISTGRRLWAARHLRGLSIRQLAKAAAISKSAAHRYETGQVNPPPQRLVDMALALEVDPFWMSGDNSRSACESITDEAWLADKLDYVPPIRQGRRQ